MFNKRKFYQNLNLKSKFSKRQTKSLSLQKIFHAEENDYRWITLCKQVPFHIGHLAGVYIPADVYARFQRRLGSDVAFICGSDEHGILLPLEQKKKA